MKGPAAKLSVRQRIREHETLLKGVASADGIIKAMDAECARLERVVRNMRIASGVMLAVIVALGGWMVLA